MEDGDEGAETGTSKQDKRSARKAKVHRFEQEDEGNGMDDEAEAEYSFDNPPENTGEYARW